MITALIGWMGSDPSAQRTSLQSATKANVNSVVAVAEQITMDAKLAADSSRGALVSASPPHLPSLRAVGSQNPARFQSLSWAARRTQSMSRLQSLHWKLGQGGPRHVLPADKAAYLGMEAAKVAHLQFTHSLVC